MGGLADRSEPISSLRYLTEGPVFNLGCQVCRGPCVVVPACRVPCSQRCDCCAGSGPFQLGLQKTARALSSVGPPVEKTRSKGEPNWSFSQHIKLATWQFKIWKALIFSAQRLQRNVCLFTHEVAFFCFSMDICGPGQSVIHILISFVWIGEW